MSEASVSRQKAAVEAAARGYFESWFEADAARMGAILHPKLVKRHLADDSSGPTHPLGRDDMVQRTHDGGGSDHPPEERTIDVEVVDIYGDIASVTVRSSIYREYLHLGCVDGRWQIINAFFAIVKAPP